jgi:flagellar motor switch protein FliN/FliY
MSETNTGPSPERIDASIIDNVDVTLESFLGQTTLTIAELHALQPGATLELSTPLNGLVELRLNGKTVACGELVAVGENFGVRITAIAR